MLMITIMLKAMWQQWWWWKWIWCHHHCRYKIILGQSINKFQWNSTPLQNKTPKLVLWECTTETLVPILKILNWNVYTGRPTQHSASR
jgi:hypothetical protein